MNSAFPNRLKAWRQQRGFTPAAAAAYVNSLQTGEPIAAETLERLEAGAVPTTADRLLLEFFMSVNPPAHLVQPVSQPA
jgi:hypothetical protein